MTLGATATTTSRRSAHVEEYVYESRTPATTTTTISGRSASLPPSLRNVPSLVPLGEALRALVGLQANWDSYGAEPPSRLVLDYTWAVGSALVECGVPIPQVFPTATGGVQLEWHGSHVSLEWEIDACATSGVFTFDDRETGERLDGELPYDTDQLVEALGRTMGG